MAPRRPFGNNVMRNLEKGAQGRRQGQELVKQSDIQPQKDEGFNPCGQPHRQGISQTDAPPCDDHKISRIFQYFHLIWADPTKSIRF
jgi:hypothetical protein